MIFVLVNLEKSIKNVAAHNLTRMFEHLKTDLEKLIDQIFLMGDYL